MRLKVTFSAVLLFAVIAQSFAANTTRTLTGAQAQQKIAGAETIIMTSNTEVPQFVQLRSNAQLPFSRFSAWAHQNFNLGTEYGFQLLNSSTDKLGMTHYRYQQTWNGIPLAATMMIVHVRNAMVVSVNGMSFNKISASASAVLNESAALDKAFNYMNAS